MIDASGINKILDVIKYSNQRRKSAAFRIFILALGCCQRYGYLHLSLDAMCQLVHVMRNDLVAHLRCFCAAHILDLTKASYYTASGGFPTMYKVASVFCPSGLDVNYHGVFMAEDLNAMTDEMFDYYKDNGGK